MFVILMTTLFDKALILAGEIWCWSLLGLKGLRKAWTLLLIATFIMPDGNGGKKNNNNKKNVNVKNEVAFFFQTISLLFHLT